MLLSCPLLETSLGVKVAGDLVAHSTAQLLVNLGLVQQCKQSLLGNDSATSKFTCEYKSEEHTSELQSQSNLVCRLLLEKKKKYHCKVHSAEIPQLLQSDSEHRSSH